MSYNITHWQTIRLESLKVPASAFRKEDFEYGPNNSVIVNLCEDHGLSGTIDGPTLLVDKVWLRGEGSGWAFEDLKKALAAGTGYLDAVIIWEGGDDITRLISIDGKVTHEQLNIVELIKENERLKE